jgi:hypothetical protein
LEFPTFDSLKSDLEDMWDAGEQAAQTAKLVLNDGFII